jgi:hypothetical protein
MIHGPKDSISKKYLYNQHAGINYQWTRLRHRMLAVFSLAIELIRAGWSASRGRQWPLWLGAVFCFVVPFSRRVIALVLSPRVRASAI